MSRKPGYWKQTTTALADRKNYTRASVSLHNGNVADVFHIVGYVLVTGMFMRITEAVSNVVCTMAWTFDPDDGAADQPIGTAISVQNKGIGVKYYAELDGTALVEVAANVLMARMLDVLSISATNFNGAGCVMYDGDIDVDMSAFAGMTTGVGDMIIEYEPITLNSRIVIGDVYYSTSTTSTSTTSTSTSTTATTTTTTTTSTTTSSTTTTAAP